MSAGLALALSGCVEGTRAVGEHLKRKAAVPAYPDAPPATITTDVDGGPPLTLGAAPSPNPGPPTLVWSGPSAERQIALTVDDGYCGDCIVKYVEFAQTSGIHITFNPNGVFGTLWAPLANSVQEMVANRQVQIGNHTWDHANLVGLSSAKIADELNRNDEWIQRTFGITSRPWFRPPYGAYDSHVNDVAASLGYTRILMWNGSFGDSTVISPQQLISLAEQYLQPGTIMLGHLNHPTILSLFDQIQSIIQERNLDPVTLDEMFGTSRTTG